MKYRVRTVAKFEGQVINEDAAIARRGCVAVSDGAGGGGVFAEKWSACLLENLPKDPIRTFVELDEWIDSIWESFYNKYEVEAKKRGGMFLTKFYDEGSYATLAAVWKEEDGIFHWITYGDSVVFFYNRATGELQNSFTELKDFSKPPYLISTNNPMDEKGCRMGSYEAADRTDVFVTSDALGQLILMAYQVCKGDEFKKEQEEVLNLKGKSANLLKRVQEMYGCREFKSFYRVLMKAMTRQKRFENQMRVWEKEGILGHDDYSMAMMQFVPE